MFVPYEPSLSTAADKDFLSHMQCFAVYCRTEVPILNADMIICANPKRCSDMVLLATRVSTGVLYYSEYYMTEHANDLRNVDGVLQVFECVGTLLLPYPSELFSSKFYHFYY
jgi:hypothetical protein